MAMTPEMKLAAGRLMACERQPYLRAALLGLIPKEAPEGMELAPGIPFETFGVTEHAVLIWSRKAVKKWNVDEIAGVLLHEVWHLLREHRARGKVVAAGQHVAEDDVQFRFDWNCAGDREINDDLKEAGWKLPGGHLMPADIGMEEGQTAEAYYRAARQQAWGQGQGAGSPQHGSGKRQAGQGQAQQGQGQQGQSRGKGQGQPGKDGRGWCGSGAGNKLPGEPESGGATPGRSSAEIQRMRRQVAEEIKQAAASSRRGSVPGSWQRWAEEVSQPAKIPWQQKLARAARGAVASRAGLVDYRYGKPSRRQAGLGYGPGHPVLPILRAPLPRVAIVADTSGSMSDRELANVIREGNGILKAVGCSVTFLANDAAIHDMRTVRTGRELAAALKGGGGTDFRPAFKALDRGRNSPDVIVYVTDGIGPAPVLPPRFSKVIWVLVGPGRRRPWAAPDADSYGGEGGGTVEWGEAIEIDDKEAA